MLTTELLTALHEERITFGDFANQTQGDFTALAASVARRWGTLPTAVEVDDIRQEMLLAVHMSLPDYNPGRSDIRKFIVFRACSAARKELQRQTRSKSRDDRVAMVDTQEPVQEAASLARQLLDRLPIGKRQHAIIHSLARTGSLDDTTVELLADPRTRNMFTRPTHNAARYAVYRTARKLAQRAQATA